MDRQIYLKKYQGMLENNYFEQMLKFLVGNKAFFIWGACYKNDWLWSLCKDVNLEISGYIDSCATDIRCFHNLEVFEPDEVLKCKGVFVFVALENKYFDVSDMLIRYGLKEFQDYLYPGGNVTTLIENHQRHIDFYGNEIRGLIDGFKVKYYGGGCRLIIGKDCKIDGSVSILLARNAIVIIGKGCVIKKNCIIECCDNALIIIGDQCHIGENTHLRVKSASVLTIGDNFSCGKNLSIGTGGESICTIGDDCMFSRNIDLQCSDAHQYFDLDSCINMNCLKEYKINIGNHVWVGADCKLLYGADIGAGSIVGMGSFVNKKFPNNIVIAGNPARCVRKNIAWNRAGYPFYNDREAFEAYDFREEGIL